MQVEESTTDMRVMAQHTPLPSVCPRCGVVDPPLYKHDVRTQEFMDTPLHGKRVHLRGLWWGGGGAVVSIGRPGGNGPWVNREGTVNPSERTPVAWDPMEAALILRPERRKVKATQFVFTPLASTPRFLTAGEWYLMGMFVCNVCGDVEAIPYKRTEVEIEIEEDEDEA